MLNKQKNSNEIPGFKNLSNFIEEEQPETIKNDNTKRVAIIEKNLDKYLAKLRKKIVKETKIVSGSVGKPTQMVIDEKKNRTNVTIFDNNFTIENSNDEYRVSVKEVALHGLVTKPNIKVICPDMYIYIEKNDYLYCVVTNKPVEENSNISFLTEENGVYSFGIDNLCIVEVENGIITLKNDEEVEKIKDNDTLLISQEEGKVYLPYKVEDLAEELKLYPNITMKQLIKVKYIQPFDKYKYSIKARYCEAYELMKYREHKSSRSAIMLGLELMFEFNLHPAIINACKNLEELDIYLDCLDDNELEKFNCFKIVYKALPTLAKLRKANKNLGYKNLG